MDTRLDFAGMQNWQIGIAESAISRCRGSEFEQDEGTLDFLTNISSLSYILCSANLLKRCSN
jgi:hypothetical protein